MTPTSRDPIASAEVVRAVVVNVIVIATCFCVMAVMIALLAAHESNFVFYTMVVVAAHLIGINVCIGVRARSRYREEYQSGEAKPVRELRRSALNLHR